MLGWLGASNKTLIKEGEKKSKRQDPMKKPIFFPFLVLAWYTNCRTMSIKAIANNFYFFLSSQSCPYDIIRKFRRFSFQGCGIHQRFVAWLVWPQNKVSIVENCLRRILIDHTRNGLAVFAVPKVPLVTRTSFEGFFESKKFDLKKATLASLQIVLFKREMDRLRKLSVSVKKVFEVSNPIDLGTRFEFIGSHIKSSLCNFVW